jgi:hypothetical protein
LVDAWGLCLGSLFIISPLITMAHQGE